MKVITKKNVSTTVYVESEDGTISANVTAITADDGIKSFEFRDGKTFDDKKMQTSNWATVPGFYINTMGLSVTDATTLSQNISDFVTACKTL